MGLALRCAQGRLRRPNSFQTNLSHPSGFVHAAPPPETQNAHRGRLHFWRRGWDSNPRYGNTVNRISNPAHSTTLPPLQKCSARNLGRARRRVVRIIPDAHPSLCSGPAFRPSKFAHPVHGARPSGRLRRPKSFQTILSLPALLSTTLPPLRKCSAWFHGRSAGALFASSLMLTPRCARGQPFGCPNSLPANSSTTLPPLQKHSARFRGTHACASTPGFVVKQTRRGEPPMIIGCPHR